MLNIGCFLKSRIKLECRKVLMDIVTLQGNNTNMIVLFLIIGR